MIADLLNGLLFLMVLKAWLYGALLIGRGMDGVLQTIDGNRTAPCPVHLQSFFEAGPGKTTLGNRPIKCPAPRLDAFAPGRTRTLPAALCLIRLGVDACD